MPELLRLLEEASLRGLAVLVLAAAALRLGRCRLRAQHATWTLVTALFLLLPLVSILDLEVLLPDSAADRASAPVSTEEPAPAESPTVQEEVWRSVRYRHPTERWQRALLAAWGLGAAGSLLHLGLGLLGLRRLRNGSVTPPVRLAPPADALPARGGLELRVSEGVSGPVLLGLRSGLLLVPPTALEWDETTLRAVLAHEAAHWRHRDLPRLLLARLAMAIYWFHPGAWWLHRRLSRLGEHRADDAGVAALGVGAYARSLARIALATASEGGLGDRLALAMARPAAVGARLERILRSSTAPDRRTRTPRRLAGAFFGVGAAVAALPLTLVLPAPSGFDREVARLASPSAEVRAEALYRLSRWPGQARRAIPHLVAKLGDEAPIARLPTWSYAEEGWAPARSGWWRASPGEVAALGLASMSARAAPWLERALAAGDPVTRRNAAWAMGELRHPRGLSRRGVDALVRALEDSVPEVRAAAAWSLGDLGARAALPSVRARLRVEHDAAARDELARTERALREGVSLEVLRRRAEAAPNPSP